MPTGGRARAGGKAAPGEMPPGRPGDGTMASAILGAHSRRAPSGQGGYRIAFDSLISHDITYVGIIQTARASGMESFPVPYALTNCHNSLCAVGGTINEDDHVFGLSAAKKYGGVYVPANQAVIHQYAREAMCEAGGMILGSDSHTRYGALGVMGVGEGGPELVKQLLGNTYDIMPPQIVLVYLENAPRRGVGPHDVAIALCGAVYANGFAKNKVLEFAGPGVAGLPMDFRMGIDVMTTETACLSSIWRTDADGAVRAYYAEHGREGAYRPLAPAEGAVYDSMISIDLAAVEPMIAMPFHPSKAYTIRALRENAADILRDVELDAERQFGGKARLSLVGKARAGGGSGAGGAAGGGAGHVAGHGSPGGAYVEADQGIIAGCAGGLFDNIREAAAILGGASVGDGYFSLSVYPPSTPVSLQLMQSGDAQALAEAGALIKPCFCGPCFGAGDVPANNGLSIRHTTRNFPNREGSSPGDGQLAAVALMDARSIAATARNGGRITPADELEYDAPSGSPPPYSAGIYEKRVYNGFGRPDAGAELRLGPNIADWPKLEPLGESLMLRIASAIRDPVTTSDELIPSGETASYRSNPMKLAGFALARRDPRYVPLARSIREIEERRARGDAAGDLAAAIGALEAAGCLAAAADPAAPAPSGTATGATASAYAAPGSGATADAYAGPVAPAPSGTATGDAAGAATVGAATEGATAGNAATAAPSAPATAATAAAYAAPGSGAAADAYAAPLAPDAPGGGQRLAAATASMQVASAIFARKPGDGSAREQAASCQRVLGGGANICCEYATKRYRSNLINWGMLPFTLAGGADFEGEPGDWVYVPGARARLAAGEPSFPAKLIRGGRVEGIELRAEGLSPEERDIILAGCLMNYYASKRGAKN
jgi:aconitate hydratase